MVTSDDTLQTLLAAIEADAARISRRLHDHASQNVAALLLGLKLLEKQVAPNGKETIARLQQISQDLGIELHRLSDDIYPLTLSDHGLAGALATCCEEWAQLLNIPVRFEAEAFGGRYPLHLENAIFRSARDLFPSVSAKGHAGQARVILSSNSEKITLVIEAGGCGIEYSNTRLSVAVARIACIDGTIAIEGFTENGITLTVVAPATRR